MNATSEKVWTLRDLRHDLALELWQARRWRNYWWHRQGRLYDAAYYSNIISYIKELGRELYPKAKA